MRRFHKEKLSLQIETLKEACLELDKVSGNKKINLCADIQDFIEAVLNYFDSVGEYELNNLNSLVEEIDLYRKEVEADRLEIVFLCYKASMRDSLESIYFSAKNDGRCDVYYIPIPYYDKNPDGSPGNTHCEAAGYYGNNYELWDYSSYDIEKRHPDIIYIMNPYDEYNSVTSVYPDFYSGRIKDMCELLVYVPYTLHDDHGPSYVGGVPGVLFADKVIVQSENIRQSYIKSIMKSVGNAPAFAVENKIVALGSPKVDKAILSCREDFKIPDSWQDIIRSKGENSLIVLYNLSIASALLLTARVDPKMYLDKIKTVFNFFKGRKNVVLWCRPHPLLMESFKSLRPELHTELESILFDYKNSNIGIYDDTSDSNRAIAFADLSYGDDSSLNFQFQVAGKPVLIQNIRNTMESIESREELEASADKFLQGEFYNYYYMIEAENNWELGRFNLAGVIKYFDVLNKHRTAVAKKYRLRYSNGDGSAGENIHRYITDLIWNRKL